MVRKINIQDPTDISDFVTTFLIGPEAAIKESNRKRARKEFRDATKDFSDLFSF